MRGDEVEGRVHLLGEVVELLHVQQLRRGRPAHAQLRVDGLDGVAGGVVEPGLKSEFGGRIGFPPPEKNELVLSIGMGCADTVPFQSKPNTPF